MAFSYGHHFVKILRDFFDFVRPSHPLDDLWWVTPTIVSAFLFSNRILRA